MTKDCYQTYDLFSTSKLCDKVVETEKTLREKTPGYDRQLFENMIMDYADKSGNLATLLANVETVAKVKEDEDFVNYFLTRPYAHEGYENFVCDLVNKQASYLRNKHRIGDE